MKKNSVVKWIGMGVLMVFCVCCFTRFPGILVSTQGAIPNKIMDQAGFEDWLVQTGRPVFSRYKGYRANYEVFSKYKILSFGTPSQVLNNRYDAKSGQYAVHGFSYDEYTVTNTYFPDDTTGVSDPRKWNNINLGQDAVVSWLRLSTREKEYIKSAPIFYRGKDFNHMNFSSLKLTEKKCVVIAVPSWDLGFALYTNHYNSAGQTRYGTLHGDGIGGITLAGNLSLAEKHGGKMPVMQADKDYVDVTFKVVSYIRSYNGLAKSSDVAVGGIKRGTKQIEKTGSGPWEMEYTVRYRRASSLMVETMQRSITETVVVWAVSTMGDLVREELVFSAALGEESEEEAPVLDNLPCDTSLSMKGAISLFQNGRTLLGYDLPYHSHRFLCLERITLRVEFEGESLPETTTFFPVGGEPHMTYVIKTSADTAYAEYSYIMGILPSSLTWSNERNREPYSLYAQYTSGGQTLLISLGGIDITGSVYDLIYMQSSVRD